MSMLGTIIDVDSLDLEKSNNGLYLNPIKHAFKGQPLIINEDDMNFVNFDF